MNTSFNLELRLPKQDGTCPIYLRITQNKKKKRISTNISVKSEDFNKKADFGKWIRRSNPKHQTLNSDLEKEIQKAKDALKKVQEMKKSPTASNIVSEIRTTSSYSFIKYFEQKLMDFETTKSISYHKHLKSKLNNLKEYIGTDELMFTDVNVSFLNKYEAYLMSKERKLGALNENSATSNLRAIRTMVYLAISEEYEFKNPFNVRKLNEFKGLKGKLSVDDIKKLELLELEKDSRLWHTLNYFLFAFYAAGQRFADVAQLKWKNIQGNRLSYTMGKTGEGQSIILHPKALAILELYRRIDNKPDSYVFPMLKEVSSKITAKELDSLISSQNAMVNINLKAIQDIAEINTKMTFHLSRHSFADILRTKEISIYDISKLLGHSDIKITERYLKGFDNKTSDAALTKGLDF
jgi:integrase